VIDHCLGATDAVTGDRNERVYISAVHVIRYKDSDFEYYKYPFKDWHRIYDSGHQVRIDYWVVKSSAQMADGSRKTRWFAFF
jgi:hypothetical protein